MKPILSYLFLLSLPVAFSRCAKTPVSGSGDTQQRAITIAAPVSNSIRDFSFYFFNHLLTEQNNTQNIFVSPISLHIALGMLVNGTTGDTRAEILHALKADNISLGDLNASYKTLMSELPAADSKVQLGLANSVWYRNSFSVKPDFLNTMKNGFDAQVTGLPFAPGDVNIINKWASDKTSGRIDKVLETINADDVMFLMNALYFKGDWASKFDKRYTVDAPFTTEEGSKVSVKMMKQLHTFLFTSYPDFDVLQIPYGNGQFNATFILPKNNNTITNVFSQLNLDKWNELQGKLDSVKMDVSIPKFNLKQEFRLNSTLNNMGMVKAFTPSGGLSDISNDPRLAVSFVKQNTFLNVDEEGSEAAAVTTIGIVVTSLPSYPTFTCNRPFGFIISEKTSNTILFMGRIQNPALTN